MLHFYDSLGFELKLNFETNYQLHNQCTLLRDNQIHMYAEAHRIAKQSKAD